MSAKPTNTKPTGCVTVPAPCVVWDGPELPGLNICKGDSITMPVYQLAKKLCTVQGYLSLENYDLSSLDLTDCDVNSFIGMIQFLLDKVATLSEEINSGKVQANSLDIDYTVPDCFIADGAVQNIVDFVANIANKVCSLNASISSLEITAQAHTARMDDLQNQITALTT